MIPSLDSPAPVRAVGNLFSRKSDARRKYAAQADRLGHYTAEQEQQDGDKSSTRAVEAKFVTAQDPVIQTASGERLPTVPIDEAIQLNALKDEAEGRTPKKEIPVRAGMRLAKDGTVHGMANTDGARDSLSSSDPNASLRDASLPSRTNPLFPPVPLYGPPTLLRSLQCYFFRFTSFWLSLNFLLVIVLGAFATNIPIVAHSVWLRLTMRDPHEARPFCEQEKENARRRQKEEQEWEGRHSSQHIYQNGHTGKADASPQFIPTEGGADPLLCDITYYARREGLDIETFSVQTEDGFIIELHHIYNPLTQSPSPPSSRQAHSPNLFTSRPSTASSATSDEPRPYPILMLHGLLQSSGAYCCTGSSSLAFYLAKSGYDIWLGNNRCGFTPRHALLKYSDPRMWSWNIRQMGVLDLSALVSRVLLETSSPHLALVAHSQGTTQTLVALAKEQRPDLGRRISVFCALAPAAYAGPLIGKAYFKFMRVLSPGLFKLVFGIHAFIPFMLSMHRFLPGKFYGDMGYLVFSFLFNWSDTRWDRGLRARCFQFSPTYVSAESMRWWLGRDCFARHKCILATRDEGMLEDREDEEDDEAIRRYYARGRNTTGYTSPDDKDDAAEDPMAGAEKPEPFARLSPEDAEERGRYAWFDADFPPLAMWVCGADDLVDGRRLLRRFDRGREPHVRVVHKKIIEGYEHLDVIWAMDCVDKVGREIKDVVWRALDERKRKGLKMPDGCAGLEPYPECVVEGEATAGQEDAVSAEERGARAVVLSDATSEASVGPLSPTQIDATAGEWTAGLEKDALGG